MSIWRPITYAGGDVGTKASEIILVSFGTHAKFYVGQNDDWLRGVRDCAKRLGDEELAHAMRVLIECVEKYKAIEVIHK